MPKYDYSCLECDYVQEFELGFEHEIPLCHKCGYRLIKVYQAPGVIFKGSGFYKTDNG